MAFILGSLAVYGLLARRNIGIFYNLLRKEKYTELNGEVFRISRLNPALNSYRADYPVNPFTGEKTILTEIKLLRKHYEEGITFSPVVTGKGGGVAVSETLKEKLTEVSRVVLRPEPLILTSLISFKVEADEYDHIHNVVPVDFSYAEVFTLPETYDITTTGQRNNLTAYFDPNVIPLSEFKVECKYLPYNKEFIMLGMENDHSTLTVHAVSDNKFYMINKWMNLRYDWRWSYLVMTLIAGGILEYNF